MFEVEQWADRWQLLCSARRYRIALLSRSKDLLRKARRYYFFGRSGVQVVEQGLGLFQIERVEAFVEPAIDRSKQSAGLIASALIALEARHAYLYARSLPLSKKMEVNFQNWAVDLSSRADKLAGRLMA